MPGCKNTETCALFKLFTMRSSLRMWRVLYCDNEEKYKTCVRLIRRQQGEEIPDNLLPDGGYLAGG